MAALDALAGRLVVDTRLHLRIETYNLDAVDELCAWIGAGKVDLLAFNDHFEEIYGQCRDAEKSGNTPSAPGSRTMRFSTFSKRCGRARPRCRRPCGGSRRRRKPRRCPARP